MHGASEELTAMVNLSPFARDPDAVVVSLHSIALHEDAVPHLWISRVTAGNPYVYDFHFDCQLYAHKELAKLNVAILQH